MNDDRPMLTAFEDLTDRAQLEHLREQHGRRAYSFRLTVDPGVRLSIHRSDHDPESRVVDHLHA